jgi:hypothetical protein
MGKVFPFDRAEAASRKVERDAAAAERGRQQHEDGAQAAAREREIHTQHHQKQAVETAQEREKRVRAAMERRSLPDKPEPEKPALPDPNRKISIEVTRGDNKFETSETLRGLQNLAAEYHRTFYRVSNPEGTIDGTSRVAVENLLAGKTVDVEEVADFPFPRRLARCALAWFLLNVAEGPADICIADAGRIVVEVTPDGRTHRVGMWQADVAASVMRKGVQP